jgi:hypothetical protein
MRKEQSAESIEQRVSYRIIPHTNHAMRSALCAMHFPELVIDFYKNIY